jgi:hypothetical protein
MLADRMNVSHDPIGHHGNFDEPTSLLMNHGSLLLNQGETPKPLRIGVFCRGKTEHSLQLWQNQPAFPKLQGETG